MLLFKTDIFIIFCMVVSMVPDAIAYNVDLAACENGWKQYDQHCYKLEENILDWKSASEKCRSMGGFLASIHSKEQNDFFEEFSKESDKFYWWIGLHDHEVDGIFAWDDGSDVNFTYWRRGEPSGNYYNIGDCASESFYPGIGKKWYVLECDKALPFICQIKISTNVITTVRRSGVSHVFMVPDAIADNVNSSPCEDGWNQYGDEYCSKFFRIPKNWLNASNSCISNGGYLASIHSEEQNDVVKDSINQIGTGLLWIGLHVDLDSKYAWIDGTKVDYTNWNPSEPDGGFPSGDCVIVSWRNLGSWYVYPCYREFHYFCQKKVTHSVIESDEVVTRNIPVFITTSEKSVDSDYSISVTTYIITVIIIVLLALTGGIIYYKRFWIEDKRLKVATIFFKRS